MIIRRYEDPWGCSQGLMPKSKAKARPNDWAQTFGGLRFRV